MNGPKLFQVLDKISDNEWTSFKKYLLQHTRRDSANYECIQKLYVHREQLDQHDYDKNIREKYFADMTPKAFSNLLSRLFGWFEDWFAISVFHSERYARELNLIKGYNQRGLFKLANQVSIKLEVKIKKAPHLNLDQNDSLAKLYHAQYYSSNPIKREKNSTLFKDCLEHYIATISERSASYMLDLENFSSIRDKEYTSEKIILEQILKVTPETALKNMLLLGFKMLKSKDLNSFLALKKNLENGSIDEGSDLFLILTIYLRRVSIDIWVENKVIDPLHILSSHQLSFSAIEKNKHQKFLPANLFNGISTIAALVDYKQTELFISKWGDKVHTTKKQSVLKFCKAINAFRHDKYEELPTLLTGLEFENHEYKVISQAIMIIAQYKLEAEDLLMTMIQNYKKQLRRNSPPIPKILKTKITNLINVIVLLYKSKYDESVVINLDNHKPVFYKMWLLKEIGK